MKRRSFSAVAIAVSFAAVIVLSSWSPGTRPLREYYQLIVYHYNNDSQENILDNYLQQALLPALHRIKISKVGVFKAIANDTSVSKTLYIIVTVSSPDMLIKIAERLSSDAAYQSAGAEYINAVYASPPYSRMETTVMRAFPLAPQLQVPALKADKKNRVYELRSYESATEKIFRNKVQMFNEGGEIGIFKKLNFNAVFYSEVIAGSKMPNLIYMTSFENMADRDAHWKSFSADTAWKKLSSMPEYQHNVSHADIIFLRPADYSDF